MTLFATMLAVSLVIFWRWSNAREEANVHSVLASWGIDSLLKISSVKNTSGLFDFYFPSYECIAETRSQTFDALSLSVTHHTGCKVTHEETLYTQTCGDIAIQMRRLGNSTVEVNVHGQP